MRMIDRLSRTFSSPLLRPVARTASFNLINTVLAGLGGILVARVLGPDGRGDYAVLIAWLGMTLIVGELGLTAAVTYFVARVPTEAKNYLKSASVLMYGSGVVCALIALAVTPLLADGREARANSFYVLAIALPISFVGAAYTFSLQATRLELWNWVRFSQPFVWFLGVLIAAFVGGVSLPFLMGILVASTAAQLLIAIRFCARTGLLGGRPSKAHVSDLLGYGIAQLASAVPTALARQLDIFVLAIAVPTADLGHYSVAVSYALLSFPIAAAIGSVVFPTQARLDDPSLGLARGAVRSVLMATLVVMVPMTVASGWALPLIFGAGFETSAEYVWLLFPGIVALSCGQVCGDLLRGAGRPRRVAAGSLLALVAMSACLLALVPTYGVRGAAVSLSCAQCTGALFLWWSLARADHALKRTT